MGAVVHTLIPGRVQAERLERAVNSYVGSRMAAMTVDLNMS